MRYLFIHQNFPGQFRHVAKALADSSEHQVIGIGETKNIQGRPALHPRIQVFGYQPHDPGSRQTHHYLRDHEAHVRRGQAVVRLLLKLRDQEKFQPDVIVVHPGWGEGLFIKDVFPQARLVNYFEYYYQGQGGDVGFDPEFPSDLDDQLRVRIKNNTQLQSLVACDVGLSPTEWQKSRYPALLRDKIQVIHEGVDTDQIRPDATAECVIAGQHWRAGDEIVTYVARNLEPYRGFHSFIRALPLLQKLRPNAQVVLVGGEGVSYGRRLPEGESYRQRYCAEVASEVDWSRVHFIGKLPYDKYLKILQVSAAHVYLTYPFVLSWSMLEAMSAGCLLVASATAPVKEVIQDRVNGVLCDFFSAEDIAHKLAEVLAAPATFAPLREKARQTAVDHYDLKNCCLPGMLKLLD